MKRVTTKQLLAEALRILKRPKGWTKHASCRHLDDKPYLAYCATGALHAAAEALKVSDRFGATGSLEIRARRLLTKQIPGDARDLSTVANFNDHRSTRKKDVIALFEKAIEA